MIFHPSRAMLPRNQDYDAMIAAATLPLIQSNAQELDALYQQYGAELDGFAAFNQSPEGKALTATAAEAALQMQREQDQFRQTRRPLLDKQKNEWHALFEREVVGK
jgi:hypothetical protein